MKQMTRETQLMPDKMLSYLEIIDKYEEPEHICVKFSGFTSRFIISELYCVNPDCPCTDALLSFTELSGTGNLLDDWLRIR